MSIEQSIPVSNKKWYQKPLGVVLLIWIFFPVGIYFMWKENVWTSKTRLIITSVFSLFIIIGLFGKKQETSAANENILENRNELVKYLTNSDGWYSYGALGAYSKHFFNADGSVLSQFGRTSDSYSTDWDGRWALTGKTVRISYNSKSGYGMPDKVFYFDSYPADDKGNSYYIGLKISGENDYLSTDNMKTFSTK